MLLLILPLKAGVDYRVVSPEQLKPIISEFLDDNRNLPKNEVSPALKEYLIKQGFTFAQVVFTETGGGPTLEVKP